jgi:diguanylate cyclase (GGDEF)-like protein/PAS domain S-box-containing protein
MRIPFFSRSEAGFILSRPSVIAVGIALAVTVVTGIYAEVQKRAVHRQSARATVSEQLGLVRARIEGNINSNLQLIRGLVAVIATQPDIDQEQFGRIAGNLLGNQSQIRNVAAAPGLVVSLMYPIEGNEKAIGLDYRKNVQQREAAHERRENRSDGARRTGRPHTGWPGIYRTFSGVPVENPAGLRTAVGTGVRGRRCRAALCRQRPGYDPDLPVDVAISGRDALHARQVRSFFGSPEIFADDPVVSEVSLPTGRWRIAAIPRGGWSGHAGKSGWNSAGHILAGGLLVILPILIAGQLYDQRRTHIKEMRQRQDEMERLSQRLKLALDTSKIGIWELNLDTSELTWDSRMRELYDIPADRETSHYATWSERLHPDDLERAEQEYWAAIETGNMYHSEFRVILRDGSIRWIRAIGAVHNDIRGQRYIVGVNWDVSSDIQLKTRLMTAKQNAEVRNRELEDARSQMEHNSLHDSLTGLPNRRFVDQQLLDRGAEKAPTALLHIDLDRFKHINDTLGHAAGDAMLVHAASVLKANTGADDFVARIGGDEFVIAVMDPMSQCQLSALAGRIIEEMRQPVPFENHECRFGVSIGIAKADRSLDDFGQRMLIDADIALYRAKSNGRNRFEFFSDTLKAEIVRNKQVADDILSGLERQEFLPYFQPQFDARTLQIVGVEALARWAHPDKGVLTPDVFLKIADELNVVPLIDRTILEQALWQKMRWDAVGISIPRLSVNVSAGRLHDTDLMDSLDGLAIEPGTVSFELLESIFLDEGDETITTNFERLRVKGIDIEIDDFGTGYASIVSLIHLNPARLKIDRQLITPIVHSESQRRLVASIIDIGQSLGIEVVAEGVETMEHVAILRDLGCDKLQGYAFAAPMPSAELISFVREERWRKVA